MINILTIGGGNGQSSILKLIYNYLKENNLLEKIDLTSIVSMSDDGRTTGVLINQMREGLGIHMPPPGDLRRCLFSLSNSKYRQEFQELFEKVIDFDGNIKDFSIKDIFIKSFVSDELLNHLESMGFKLFNNHLELNFPIKGHKLGNIFMANLYYNLLDYNLMLKEISNILEIKGQVLPVTTDKAFIQAVIDDGQIIKTQDRISNIVDYNGNIDSIELMQCSKNTNVNSEIITKINNADFIIITPGDLYTSIDTNFIINGFRDIIDKSSAKKIYLLNQCNKNGETTDFRELCFIKFIQNRLNNKLDYVFANNQLPYLSSKYLKDFKNDISVKGGSYLYIDNNKKQDIISKYKNLNIITGDYLDIETLYKYNSTLITDLFNLILQD